MRLYIIRHGEADIPEGSDEQCLTQLGRRQSQARARDLEDAGIEILIYSPKLRAAQTAEEIMGCLNVDKVECSDSLVPGGIVSEVTVLINSLPSSSNVALVSHLPLVGNLAEWLCNGSMDGSRFRSFPNAGVAELDLDYVGPGQARLLRFEGVDV